MVIAASSSAVAVGIAGRWHYNLSPMNASAPTPERPVAHDFDLDRAPAPADT
jgi:hypothetical protein